MLIQRFSRETIRGLNSSLLVSFNLPNPKDRKWTSHREFPKNRQLWRRPFSGRFIEVPSKASSSPSLTRRPMWSATLAPFSCTLMIPMPTVAAPSMPKRYLFFFFLFLTDCFCFLKTKYFSFLIHLLAMIFGGFESLFKEYLLLSYLIYFLAEMFF